MTSELVKHGAFPSFGGWALVVIAAATLGCKGAQTDANDTSTEGGTQGTEDETGEEQGLTYWQDIAPIYYASCVSCHSEAGIGPFALGGYEVAAEWAELAAASVESRQMPPWLMLDDGSCNTWQHSRTLSQTQIEMIVAWADAGAPEGEPRDDLSVPELPGLTGANAFLATPEFVPEPEGGFLTENDEYRCFLVDPQLTQTQFLTGYDVSPGNQGLVHHVIALFVDPLAIAESGVSNLEVIEALDAESPDRLGWPCFALNEDFQPTSLPVVWGPGQGAVELPGNSGQRIDAGNLMVVQIHYNMTDTSLIGQSDTTSVELRLADEVEHEGHFDIFLGLIRTLLDGAPHAIPPGEAAHEFTYQVPGEVYNGPIGEQTVELWGFLPHMHTRGVRMSARVLDGQGQEVACLGDIPRWDFNWQLYYFLDQPIVIEPDYKVEFTCTYDTTNEAAVVLPGWGTQNEMCFAGLYLVEQ